MCLPPHLFCYSRSGFLPLSAQRCLVSFLCLCIAFALSSLLHPLACDFHTLDLMTSPRPAFLSLLTKSLDLLWVGSKLHDCSIHSHSTPSLICRCGVEVIPQDAFPDPLSTPPRTKEMTGEGGDERGYFLICALTCASEDHS